MRCGTFWFTHAGEAHLLGFAPCLLFRHQRLKLRNLPFTLCLYRFGFDYGLFGQPHVIRTVDDLALTFGQICVSDTLTLEFRDKRFGDVLDVGLDDRQQQLKACVLSCFLALALHLSGQFGEVRLELQAFFFRLGFGSFALVLRIQLLDLLGFQLVDHVAGLGVTFSRSLFGFGFFNRRGTGYTATARHFHSAISAFNTRQTKLTFFRFLTKGFRECRFLATTCKFLSEFVKPRQRVGCLLILFLCGSNLVACKCGAGECQCFGGLLTLGCGCFFVQTQRCTTSLAANGHVNDQAGQCTDSSAVGTFFS